MSTTSATNHRMVRRNVSSKSTDNVSHMISENPQEASRLTLLPLSASFRMNGNSSNSDNLQRTIRPPTASATSLRGHDSFDGSSGRKLHPQQQRITICRFRRTLLLIVILAIPMSYFIITVYMTRSLVIQSMIPKKVINHGRKESLDKESRTNLQQTQQHHKNQVLSGFDTILKRAMTHTDTCRNLQPSNEFRGFDTRYEMPFHNDTVASLPAFGIISAIQSYVDNEPNANDSNEWPICQIPPNNECEETQLTVIFMAYNPDRLGITLAEIKRMFDPTIFHNLIKEVILVWNGERHIDESQDGQVLLYYIKNHPIRIVYPLKMGFPNDLMNRYHPQVVQPTTKALLYYDDDGPFYSYIAIQAGFELWKRHSKAQIGAMARQITISPRQHESKVTLLGAETTKKTKPSDTEFISHCTNVDDQVDYEFHFFANYDANMVLPSGSMLHSNYLCYLWHPIFAEIRQFVLQHPVHPDDMTVSMIVSQLSGVAPRVYSRKLHAKALPAQEERKRHQRQLFEMVSSQNEVGQEVDESDSDEETDLDMGIIPISERQRHRSLMFSICWDCGSGMTEMKQYWAELRTEAVNSLVRYFGSINSGSIGWCAEDSEYYNVNKDGRCWPLMARQGMLPWMNLDGTPKDSCP